MGQLVALRVVVPTVLTAAVSSGLAVWVNLATEWKTSQWAWVVVAVLTVISAAMSLHMQPTRTRPERTRFERAKLEVEREGMERELRRRPDKGHPVLPASGLTTSPDPIKLPDQIKPPKLSVPSIP